MNKSLVKIRNRFYLEDRFGFTEFYFSYNKSNQLQIMRKGGHHIALVREVLEDGIYVSVWILQKEASVFIPYSKMNYLEPKNS